MKLRNVTLELSAKPFLNDSEEMMYAVGRTLFRQWIPLTAEADTVSVLLWLADGSEILEYTGDPEQTFEWGYWQGIANPLPPPKNPTAWEKRYLNYYPVKYRPDAAPRTYAWLKRMIEVLRETGNEITGKPIRIGATFDNGPEFSVSDFKYRRHREIAQGHSIYPHSFVTCNSVLHADSRAYAGFPSGIPEGTTLGEFLGRQYREFARDLGYDYIWLSNGMGFGTETWGITGELFDKERFHPERRTEAARKMLRFWHDFLDAAPGTVIETRGSDYPAGIEIATDAAPLAWLYREKIIAPPINSPKAAILYNPGLELAAWQSHIAELPDGWYSFRFYIHDPWFLNTPWLDRYAREPWDIFLPLSVARINETGRPQSPEGIELLSCDNSFGQMPQQVPDEVQPLLAEAFRDAPDQTGPFLWIYPFDEYAASERIDKTFSEELFFAEALENGAPVNTVISTKVFRSLLEQGKAPLHSATPIVPLTVLDCPDLRARLEQHLRSGGNALFYGALNSSAKETAELLGLTSAAPLDGFAEIRLAARFDTVADGSFGPTVPILPQFDGGGLTEIIEDAVLLAAARIGDEERAILTVKRFPGGGRAIFVRSIISCQPVQLPPGASMPRRRNLLRCTPAEYFPTPSLMRRALEEFDWRIRCRMETPGRPPVLTISRNRNAFLFNGYVPDTTVTLEMSTPFGVPIPEDREIRLENGVGLWRPGRTIHAACRGFIRQSAASTVSCHLHIAYHPKQTGKLGYTNLRDAEVRVFLPEERCAEELEVKPGYYGEQLLPFEWEETPQGRCLLVRHVTGSVVIGW